MDNNSWKDVTMVTVRVEKTIKEETDKVFEKGKKSILIFTGIICAFFIFCIVVMSIDLIRTPMRPDGDGRGWAIGFGILLGFPIFAISLGTHLFNLYTCRKKYKIAIKNIKELGEKNPELIEIKSIISKEEKKEKFFSIISGIILGFFTLILYLVISVIIWFKLSVYFN